jgi:hypothetical protein
MGLGQAEQHLTLSVHMYSCLYSTVQQAGDSLASVGLHKLGEEQKHRYRYNIDICSVWNFRPCPANVGLRSLAATLRRVTYVLFQNLCY